MNRSTQATAARVSHRFASLSLVCGGLLAGATATAAHAADLHHGFDVDAEGITVPGAQVTAASGYLVLQDIDGSDLAAQLPTSDLGDWTRFAGGTFSFDAINLNGAANDWGTFGTLRIESGAQALELDFVPTPAPASSWTTYSVRLDTTTWGVNLPAVLSNVTRVALTLESHSGFDASNGGFELNGLDNIRVTAVPEPQTWALMGVGMMVLGVVVDRRRRRFGQG
jgi:hypothetical protein